MKVKYNVKVKDKYAVQIIKSGKSLRFMILKAWGCNSTQPFKSVTLFIFDWISIVSTVHKYSLFTDKSCLLLITRFIEKQKRFSAYFDGLRYLSSTAPYSNCCQTSTSAHFNLVGDFPNHVSILPLPILTHFPALWLAPKQAKWHCANGPYSK